MGLAFLNMVKVFSSSLQTGRCALLGMHGVWGCSSSDHISMTSTFSFFLR